MDSQLYFSSTTFPATGMAVLRPLWPGRIQAANRKQDV
jgi:hypothetical protein